MLKVADGDNARMVYMSARFTTYVHSPLTRSLTDLSPKPAPSCPETKYVLPPLPSSSSVTDALAC
jgi:hypothetical protein